MNVFVLCAGRCGSTTFIKAAQHICNFTSGHETLSGFIGDVRFNYPLNHIEAEIDYHGYLEGLKNIMEKMHAMYI